MIREKIKHKAGAVWRRLKGDKTTIDIGGRTLTLDLTWKHERDYLRWAHEGYLNGPIAFDTIAIKQLTRPGDRVLDAGANIGFTALLFLEAGAEFVYAFEPDPRNYRRLSKLACKQIQVSDFALGNCDSKLALMLSETHNQGSTLDDRIVARFPTLFSNSKTVTVDVRKLDTVCSNDTFDFLKIDVEGGEVDLLSGAMHLIESKRPRTVLIESYPEIFPELHKVLSPLYSHCARLICSMTDSHLKYVEALTDIENYKTDYYTMPPTYVYSTEPLPLT